MSRTRTRSHQTQDRTRKLLRALAWALLLACTGCDQFFPYDKVPVQVCGPVDSLRTEDGTGIASDQLCYTKWVRATPPALTSCTTDQDCADRNPGTDGSPTPASAR